MSDYRTYASATVPPRFRSAELIDRCSSEPDSLRTKAARYRLLAETLADPRVIAVVQACAMDLETEAVLTESVDRSLDS